MKRKKEGVRSDLYFVMFVCSLASNLLVQLFIPMTSLFNTLIFVVTLFSTLLFLYLLVLNSIVIKLTKAKMLLFCLIFPVIMFFAFWFGLSGYCDLLNLSKTGDCGLVAIIVLPITVIVAVVAPVITMLTRRRHRRYTIG